MPTTPTKPEPTGQWAKLEEELSASFEEELRRAGVAAHCRRTRAELGERIARAIKGQLTDLEELKRLSPPEKMVADPAAGAIAPYLAVKNKLQQMSEETALLRHRERSASAREVYERKLARRDEKIRTLQALVEELSADLSDVRRAAAARERELEDQLLSRALEMTQLAQRCEAAEARASALERQQPPSQRAARSLDKLLESVVAVRKPGAIPGCGSGALYGGEDGAAAGAAAAAGGSWQRLREATRAATATPGGVLPTPRLGDPGASYGY